jgi:aquaporin Z
MFTDESIWKSLLIEFIGTFTLVLIGCMVVASYGGAPENAVAACFAFGLALMGIIYTWGSFSGAHVNPAVSLGFAVAGRMNWILMFLYWIVQFLGAIAAAALIVYFLPGTSYGASSGKFTQNTTQPDGFNYYDLGKALLLEMFLTLFFVMVILIVTGNPKFSAIAGFAIGLTLTFCMFAGYEWSGGSLNPARSLGPAIFAGQLNIYWVYLVGPLIGAILAALIYRFFIQDYSCCAKKDSCGNILKDDCGNVIKECKRPKLDKCGNKIKGSCNDSQYESYTKVDQQLSYK